MNSYRRPAGHRPYLPPTTGNQAGPLAGLCAVVLIAAMLLLALLSLDRVASAPAAHPAPAGLELLDDPHHEALVAGVAR